MPTVAQDNKTIPSHEIACKQNPRILDFVNNTLKQITPQELQYMANVIYFSYTTNSLTTHIESKANEILGLAKATYSGLIEGNTIIKTKDSLVKVLNTIEGAIKEQQAHATIWKHCVDDLESTPWASTASKTLELIDNAIQEEIDQLVAQYRENIQQEMENASKDLIKAGDTLNSIGYKCKNIEREPIASTPKGRITQMIDAIALQNSKVIDHSWQAIHAASIIRNIEISIKNTEQELLLNYYYALLFLLKEHSPQYHTIMYDTNGLILPENRIAKLPGIV
jgi:gas vesicle protein